MGSRLNTAHSTLTYMNRFIVQATMEPGAGGLRETSAYAAAPRSRPKSGPASESTNCRPGPGGARKRGNVTPPKACSWISGCPPKARPTRACPSSCTSTLTKTTTTQAAICQPNPRLPPRRMALKKNQG